MEISILIWDHDLSPRDDSSVYVALRARASPHEVCPRGSLNAYCRSSVWIGWLVFETGPERGGGSSGAGRHEAYSSGYSTQ